MASDGNYILMFMPKLVKFCKMNNICIDCVSYAEYPSYLYFDFTFYIDYYHHCLCKISEPTSVDRLDDEEDFLLERITSYFKLKTKNRLFDPGIPENKKIILRSALGIKSDPIPEIKKVIFNEPATIVIWEDGTKTIVKYGKEHAVFDPEKGLAMAIAKKALGNTGRYYETFKKWLPEEE